MRKFFSRKEQLEWATKLLQKLANPNIGGVTPIIKKMIVEDYIRRIKK
tara:strand:+ start:297 stop:440 length:144 start_codon:yes stop_codon:yes gene_type:complete